MGDGRPYASVVNVPSVIGIVVSSGLATLHELQSVYGIQDMYDLLEILTVDRYNQRLAQKEL